MSESNVIRRFAEQRSGAKLALKETVTRDAIIHGRRTIGYINIGAELWGQLLVDRFNTHENLVDALQGLRHAFRECIGHAAFAEFEASNPQVIAANRAIAEGLP